MFLQQRLKTTSTILSVLLVLIVLAWVFVRPKGVTNGNDIVRAVDKTGWIRGLVEQTVSAARRLENIDTETSDLQIASQRELVRTLSEACAEVPVTEDDSRWIPVAEAQMLLEKTQDFAQLALDRSPSRQVNAQQAAEADPTETRPDQTGMTSDNAAVLTERGGQLRDESERLQAAVRRAALNAAFARGTWLYFEAQDFLLALGVVACLLGILTAFSCRRRLAISPTQAVEDEIRLLARIDARQAVDRCYQQSEVFLKLADVILAQAGVHGNEAHAERTTSAAS